MTTVANAEKPRRQTYLHASEDEWRLDQVYASYTQAGTGASANPSAEAVVRRQTTSNSVGFQHKVVLVNPLQLAVLHPTPAENLTLVREVLNPSVLELANIFGVSRQAVHAWQKGAQPNSGAELKLAALAQAARVFVGAGVTVSAQTLHRKVGSGETLLNTILHDKDAAQLAQSLVQTLKREDSQRAQLRRQLLGRAPASVRPEDYGSPHFASDD